MIYRNYHHVHDYFSNDGLMCIFYLNQTSSESNFNDAELYENVNRIVKLIDYKPVGKQSSVLPIEIKGTSDMSVGYYTVPKFTFWWRYYN